MATTSTISVLDGTTTEKSNQTITFDDVEIDFYVSMAFSIASLMIVTYVIISFTHFVWIKNFCLCSRASSTFAVQGGNRKARRDGAVMSACIYVSAFALLVYMAVEIPLLWTINSPFCVHYHQTKICCTAIGLFCVYFTLWYRVHTIFYGNPLLKGSSSRVARMLNKLTVPLLVIMTAVNIAVFLTGPLYETTSIGCMKVQGKSSTIIKWCLLVSTTVVFQTMLLFSLIYPLNLHRKKMLGRGIEAKTMVPLIKRAAITAGICILSDTGNALYALINKQQFVYIRHVVYGSNILINFLALMFSFADWRDRLLPCLVVDNSSTSALAKKNISKNKNTRLSTVV